MRPNGDLASLYVKSLHTKYYIIVVCEFKSRQCCLPFFHFQWEHFHVDLYHSHVIPLEISVLISLTLMSVSLCHWWHVCFLSIGNLSFHYLLIDIKPQIKLQVCPHLHSNQPFICECFHLSGGATLWLLAHVNVPRWSCLGREYSDWPGIVSDKAHSEITVDPLASCFLLRLAAQADQTDIDPTDNYTLWGWPTGMKHTHTHTGAQGPRPGITPCHVSRQPVFGQL